MRLVTFEHPGGRRSFGALEPDGGIADVGSVVAASHRDLTSVLAQGALGELAAALEQAPRVPEGAVRLLTPLPEARRIFCVGVNYREHRSEMDLLEPGRAVGAHPTIFVRFASSLVGHGTPVERPTVSEQLDYEGELAVVVGRAGRHLGAAEALGHVAGYSCFLDGSVRDFQRHSSQYIPGKNFDRSGGFGPALVTAEEVGDPSRLRLRTRVDGEVRQDATTDLMIFSVGEVLSYLSQFTELQPGDVIATGTPGGVGAARQPPRWLAPGQLVEVEISGVGVLRHPVVFG